VSRQELVLHDVIELSGGGVGNDQAQRRPGFGPLARVDVDRRWQVLDHLQ